MGNRAVIAHTSMPEVGIYVHWNGGPESILAMLDVAREVGVRTADASYGMARLTQIIGEWFSNDGGGYETSVGIGPLEELDTDNMDNGLYWIDDTFAIVKREHTDSGIMLASDLPQAEHERYVKIKESIKAALHIPQER